MKLLDIIVYSVNNSNKLFLFLKNKFPPNKFILYKVSKEELFSKSWYKSFKILIIDCSENKIYDKQIFEIISELIFAKKKILLISDVFKSECLENWKLENVKIEIINENITVLSKLNKTYFLLYKNLDTLLSNCNVISDTWSIYPPSDSSVQSYETNIYLLSESQKIKTDFLQTVKLKSPDENVIHFQYNDANFVINLHENKLNDSDTKHTLLTCSNNSNEKLSEILSFKPEEYFSSLSTKYLGKILLFSEILTSSFDLMEKLVRLGNYHSMIIVSYVQTQGKGRGSNTWISPLGCAMFTCLIPIEIKSRLGSSMSLIQHIVAVSIVEAIRFVCWINEDALKIKWPNDVYWNTRGKIAGIKLNTVMNGDSFYCIAGCGVNVFNKEPSVCIYDMIEKDNNKNKLPSIEEIIAHIMTRIESNIRNIQSDRNGIEFFKNKYYKYWMHKDQNVTVQREDKSISGRIIGIDDFGFLQMIPNNIANDNQLVSLHPDGNSFDMMHNLIIPK